MDAFFASVEQLDDPKLRGKPVLVGHDGPRGVVAAASYESRVFGCHSAQPMAVAKRLCPHAIVVPGHFARYRDVSRQVFDVFERVTPRVEPLSIDEAFLDLTGTERLLGPADAVAKRLKQEILSTTGLTASIGVAPNKFLAKLASDLEKPDGLTVITRENLDRVLLPLPISRLWGVGPRTAQKLEGIGIRTFADVRRMPLELLFARFGEEGEHYRRLAFGEDDREVVADSAAKSIGQEQTFGTDVADVEELRRVLLGQAEHVGHRLRRHGLRARAVVVKIRYGDFETITRSSTLEQPTDITHDLYRAGRDLFDRWAAHTFQPVRLIGLTAARLSTDAGQMHLFTQGESDRHRRLDQALDRINDRFGKNVIRRGNAEEE